MLRTPFPGFQQGKTLQAHQGIKAQGLQALMQTTVGNLTLPFPSSIKDLIAGQEVFLGGSFDDPVVSFHLNFRTL